MMKNLRQNFIATFIIGTVLLAGIAIALNMIFDNINLGRFDLTADRIYELSPSVETILSQLDAPIELTYYVSSSEKMPTQWKNLERDVIDKLKDLKLASKGMLTYTVFDPSTEEEKEAFEEQKAQEEEAENPIEKKQPEVSRKKIAERLYEKGVIPFGVQSTERDEFAVKRVYSSIVLSYLDRKEDVIQEVRPGNFGNLEYEIMSRIYKLISNKRPRIAFYPGKPEIPPEYRQYYRQQTPPDYFEQTVQMLKEAGYDVTRTNIKEDDPIPDDIQTLVIMAIQPLNQRQLYEIDKQIHKGVRIVLAGQTYQYQISASRTPGEFDLRGMPTRMNINDILENYGLEFDDQMFMDKSSTYIQIPVSQMRDMGVFQVRQQRFEPVTKPVLIQIEPENINTHLSISNKITDLFYMYGGRIVLNRDKLKENNLSYETLFTSSDHSWVKKGSPYANVDITVPGSSDILKHQTLGVLVEGKFKSKYTDATIPPWPAQPGEEQADKKEDQPSEITGEPKDNKMIVIGCANMFNSNVLQSVAGNRVLLQNCVDALTLGDELINIRSKNIVARRIRTIGPAAKAFWKFFVIWVPALIFAGLGIFVNIKRRKKNILQMR